jgi:hypothetical protein
VARYFCSESASIGSVLEARRAGIVQAMSATTASTPETEANTTGSMPLTPVEARWTPTPG